MQFRIVYTDTSTDWLEKNLNTKLKFLQATQITRLLALMPDKVVGNFNVGYISPDGSLMIWDQKKNTVLLAPVKDTQVSYRLVAHILGHMAWNYLLSINEDFADRYSDIRNIEDDHLFGVQDPQEDFASNYAAFLLKPALLRNKNRLRYTYINELYKEMWTQ